MKRLLFVAFCATVFSACGGGGGGGGAAVPSTPSVPASTPAPVQQTSVQRAVAAQSLAGFAGAQQATAYGGLGGTPVLSVRRQLEDAALRVTAAYRTGARATGATTRRAQSVAYSACSNGTESASVTVSAVEEQIYERTFYDSACASLRQDLYLDLVAASATSASATGNVTLYTPSGAVSAYETVTMTIAVPASGTLNFSLLMTDAPSASATPLGSIGVACGVTSSTLSCGSGVVSRASGLTQDLGATVGFTLTVPISSYAGTITVPVNGSASTYMGALGALGLSAGTFPAFVVTGGTLVDSGTFTGNLVYTTSGTPVSASLILTDTASDATASMTAGGTPWMLKGIVKRTSTGDVLASFTVDAAGNGTITYSNGTTGQIVNWQVVG